MGQPDGARLGTEFGQGHEWDSQTVLDWWVLDYPLHQGVRQLVRDLNGLYHNTQALHGNEFDWHGFEWIDCHDARQSVLSYVRKSGDEMVVVALNFTPVPRVGYRIGVPKPGTWKEVLNSDSAFYGGSNLGNGLADLETIEGEWMGRPWSLVVNVPPLAGIVLRPAPQPQPQEESDEEAAPEE